MAAGGGRRAWPVTVTAATLRPHRPADSLQIAAWVESPTELQAWASIDEWPPASALFERWHADPDVHPFVLTDGGETVGYGEVWHDADEHEAELAHIIVDPAARNRGHGRRLTELLAAEAGRAGFDDVYLRVVPANAAAVACYRSAGFQPLAAEQQRLFNEGQPQSYIWMRRAC